MIEFNPKKYDGHTAGPWTSLQHDSVGMRHAITGEGMFVARIPGPGAHSCLAETDGNAALITDAPDLLALCIELKARLEIAEKGWEKDHARLLELEQGLENVSGCDALAEGAMQRSRLLRRAGNEARALLGRTTPEATLPKVGED